MSDKPKGWSTHGRAVDVRNDVAEKQLDIMKEADELMKLAERGELTRLAVILAATCIRNSAASCLVQLVQQGAPIHPERLR